MCLALGCADADGHEPPETGTSAASASDSDTGVGGSSGEPGSDSAPGTAPPGDPSFTPCVIDVSNVGASCGAADPAACDGADIAHNYALWPDPYACFVCAPGTYAEGVTASSYATLADDWYEIATTRGTPMFQASAGADAYVVDLVLEDGQPIQAAVSFGHGVLDGKCGDTFLVEVGSKYVLLFQTDIRAWSLELSPGANTWLDPTNVGGTCIIPEVRRIDASFVIDQFL